MCVHVSICVCVCWILIGASAEPLSEAQCVAIHKIARISRDCCRLTDSITVMKRLEGIGLHFGSVILS